MELSLNDLQHVRRTLKRTPPPKAPSSPGQKDPAPSSTGPSSVALFRNKFEQKPTPPSKGHKEGSSPCQYGVQPSEEKVISVASAKAKFEQNSFVKSAPAWKQSTGNQSKAGSSILDENSNAYKVEPPRKTLPAYFRIGAAPGKPAKPDHLKFRLRKFQDKIMILNGETTAAITSKEGESKHQSIHQLKL